MQGHGRHETGQRHGLRRASCAALVLCAFLASGFAPASKGSAAVVADIAAFVRWPEDADYGLSFRLCLRDDDPAFGQFVVHRGMTVQGKPLTVHSLSPDEFGRRPCHMAYFSSGYADEVILQRLRHQPVLTISPQRGFASRGGLVELNRETGRLVLIMDRAALVGHPLAFSAQLLALSHQAGE